MFAALALTNDSFLTLDNLSGLLSSAAVWTTLSLGAAVIILAGAIDISFGALVALSAGVAGLVLKLPYSPSVTIPAGILAALAVGAGGGAINAALSLAGRVHPIVITLGTMTIYRGLIVALTGGDTITDLPSGFIAWSTARLWGVNGSVALGARSPSRPTCGSRTCAAAGMSSPKVRVPPPHGWSASRARTWLLAFGAGGTLAALAGLLELSQTGAIGPGMASGYELQAIAAAVIGGVSITGGRGSVVGVCLGAAVEPDLQRGRAVANFALPLFARHRAVAAVRGARRSGLAETRPMSFAVARRGRRTC